MSIHGYDTERGCTVVISPLVSGSQYRSIEDVTVSGILLPATPKLLSESSSELTKNIMKNSQ